MATILTGSPKETSKLEIEDPRITVPVSEKTLELETGGTLTATTTPRETLGSKTRGTFTTATDPRKILRSKTRETLTKDKEKVTQSSWELTYGKQDRKGLLLFEDNVTFVVYEKRINKTIAPFSKSSPSDLETKKVSERQKQQLLKVILCRTEIRGIKNLKSLAGYSGHSLSTLLVPTGKRPLTIFMLFGDGRKVDKARQERGWEPFDSNFLALNRATNIPLDHYTHHFSFPPWDISGKDKSRKNAQEVAKFLKELGSLDTDTFLGITTGDISQSLCKSLFDTLNNQGWFNTEDCTFLKEIVPFRELSKEQVTLSMQIEYMVTKPESDYKEAIALTKKIHQLSRKEAYKRGTSSVYMDENSRKEINLIDDCHIAFKLGKHLESRGLLALKLEKHLESRNLLTLAVEAFKILTDNVVNTIGKVSVTYHSFYANKARSKIEKFQEPSTTSSLTIDSESEKLREKVIEENLTSLVKGGDVNIDFFLNSLEIQCGFPSESDLFRDVDKKGKHEEILSKVLLNMATKICQQQGELLLLQSESKEKAEIGGSKPAQVVQTKRVQKASGELLSVKTSAKSLLRPLEEEDDDENFPPSPTSPPSLHFAYPPRRNSIIKKSMSSPPEAAVWKSLTHTSS